MLDKKEFALVTFSMLLISKFKLFYLHFLHSLHFALKTLATLKISLKDNIFFCSLKPRFDSLKNGHGI